MTQKHDDSRSISAAAWRLDPAGYAQKLSKGRWTLAPHLDLISRTVADAVRAGGGRIVVEVPPRHGKSELLSYWTPLWFLDRWPDKRVVVASYAESLARGFSRRVRDAVSAHAGYLRVRVNENASSAEDWSTTTGEPPGGMLAVGVGGGLTGRGADLLIIDDPIKSSEEADSPTVRSNVWSWWETVARQRLEPNAAVIVVMTRWNVDDLAGRLLKQVASGGERWDEVRLPALAEADDQLGRAEGEALWPERYSREYLEEEKASMSARAFAAVKQQKPVATEGAMFQRTWFEIIDVAPDHLMPVRGWDLAGSKASKADPDYTAGALVAVKSGQVYILNIQRMRGSPGDVEKRVTQTAKLDGRSVRIRLEQEPGQSGIAQIEHYKTLLLGFAFKGERSTGPKTLRAEAWSGLAQSGRVKLLKGPWNAEFLNEVESFPVGDHDDQVDAVSIAFAAASLKRSIWDGVAAKGEQLVTDPYRERDEFDEALAKGEKWAVDRDAMSSFFGDRKPPDPEDLFRFW